MHGAIDEVRISNSARPADWIATEYNNQNSPATFYTIYPENATLVAPANTVLSSSQSQQFTAIFTANAGAPPLTLLGAVQTPSPAESLAVNGNLAYLCDDNEVSVIDVANPSAPVFLNTALASSIANDGAAYCAIQRGALVAFVDETSSELGNNPSFVAFDLTNPALYQGSTVGSAAGFDVDANYWKEGDRVVNTAIDAMNVNLINNTIISNDSTASAGVLFNTLGAPLASSQGPTCTANCGTTSAPQPAGLVSMVNSSNLTSTFTGLTITCPAGHSNCTSFSNPLLANDVFWQNRTYYIGVGALSPTYQQNIVSLYNSFTTTPAPSQPSADATTANGNGVVITGGTGACTAASYWDIGVRGDTAPGNHASGYTLAPTWSVLTNVSETGTGSHNQTENPLFTSQYCNGSRIPPEFGGTGYQVPPGISDATVPNPVFNLTPAATVDEGNNWINISWGPLAMTGPSGAMLGNFTLLSSSPAIDHIPTNETLVSGVSYPTTDFFGNPRPDPSLTSRFDIGAVELQGKATGQKVPVLTSIAPNTGVRGTTVSVTLTGTGLTDVTGVNAGDGINVTTLTVISDTTVTALLQIPSTATLTTNAPISVTDGVTGITSNNLSI